MSLKRSWSSENFPRSCLSVGEDTRWNFPGAKVLKRRSWREGCGLVGVALRPQARGVGVLSPQPEGILSWEYTGQGVFKTKGTDSSEVQALFQDHVGVPRFCELPRPDLHAYVGVCPELILLAADSCAFIARWGCQGLAVRQDLDRLDVCAGWSSTLPLRSQWHWLDLGGGTGWAELSLHVSVPVWNSEESKTTKFDPGVPCY